MRRGDAERRPGRGSGVHEQGSEPAAIVAQQVRARRDAADRLPPLASGVRDPLDDVAWPYSRAGVAVVAEHFEALGLLDPFLRDELRRQWAEAAA